MVNISEFRALESDSNDDDTESFEAAIRYIHEQGGGRLLVHGPAEYRIRPINLTSHLVLLVGANTTIKAIDDPSRWPLIPPLPSYGQGREHRGLRYSSLLHGEHLTNVSIIGHGPTSQIDGSGESWWERRKEGTDQYTRGSLIEFMYSREIKIHDLKLKDSPFWTNHFYDCDDVHVNNVRIEAPDESPNTDGWDPDSSRNVLIENSSYQGGDDCVAIKSGWDCFGIGRCCAPYPYQVLPQNAGNQILTQYRRV